MRQASYRVPAPDVDDPLREERPIGDTVPPEGFGDARVAGGETTKGLVRYAQDRRFAQRPEPPSGLRADDRRQVGHVTPNVQTGDLSGPVAILSEAPHETFDDEAGMIDLFAEKYDVGVNGNLLHLPGETEQSPLFLVGENRS